MNELSSTALLRQKRYFGRCIRTEHYCFARVANLRDDSSDDSRNRW